MKIEAIAFVWSGREMVPLDRFRPLANRQFQPGKEYALIPHQPRSAKAQGLYFKAIEVAWQNMPHQYDGRFPTSEHLRRWALINEGYADEHTMVLDSHEKALEIASLCRSLDGYAVIRVRGNITTIWAAKSQSPHHMDHDDFQRSVDKVLGRVAHMLGISIDELTDNAKASMKRIKESS